MVFLQTKSGNVGREHHAQLGGTVFQLTGVVFGVVVSRNFPPYVFV